MTCPTFALLRRQFYAAASIIAPATTTYGGIDSLCLTPATLREVEAARQSPEYQQALANYRTHRASCPECAKKGK